MDRARPTGEVTFLFTDIEGSTALVDRLGTAAWRPMLERHRSLIRDALARNAGLELQTEGDSFFAVFRDAANAVGAAADAQRALHAEPWPEGASIRVRIGIHTGTGELDADGSYVGHDVHRAARVAGAANGGQVLLSEATSALVTGRLPDGVTLRALGSHRLKDLRPERLSQLDVDGLPSEFAPIHSLDTRPNNLPEQLTGFIGREQEIAEVRGMLERSRLVTLTGPGGTGKTRLSLQVAANVTDDFPDGVWFVALSSVTDPAMVLPSISHTMGLADNPQVGPLELLVRELADHRVLLVLDNMEQLLESAGDISGLLHRAPRLRILATSRAPLRLSGEQEYPVPGLPAPVELHRLSPYQREHLTAAQRSRDPATLGQFAAVELFLARARAVRPGFELTAANAGDVAAIVAHLDGIPLAIELAAARLRFLTPAAIHERLEGRLDLPGSSSSDVPERQRTLRGAIAWSYELLDPPTQRLFERLGVFSGGFDLRCAESVAGGDGKLGIDVLEGLAALVDQSLVRSDELSGEPRFALLEPIREFALEQLAGSGDEELARERHAHAYHDLATRLEPDISGAGQRLVLDRLELEHANIRAGIDWADARSDGVLAIEISVAVWRFWQKRGHLREARSRMETMIGRAWFEELPLALRARAHEVLGGIIYWHGDMIGARPSYEAALALWREAGDEAEVANALYNLSFTYSMATAADAESRRISAGILDEALATYRTLDDDRGMANVLWAQGIQAYFANDNVAAAPLFAEALALYRKVGDRTQEAWALHQLGSTRLKLREPAAARELIRDALRIFEETGDISGMTMAMDDLAAVAVTDGDIFRAARLDGLARRLQASSGAMLAGVVQQAFESATRPEASDHLDPRELERHRAEGAAFALPDGIRYALGEEVAIPSRDVTVDAQAAP
jgi:predicted ATPase/class 3 adenylate cyclase